jgi:hypothetical protein
MPNTNKLLAGVKSADLSYANGQFDYKPFSGSVAPLAGLAAGGIGAGLGMLRNRMRPEKDRKKHNDALFYGAAAGLPVAFAPSLFDAFVKYRPTSLLAGNNLVKAPRYAQDFVLDYLKKQNMTGIGNAATVINSIGSGSAADTVKSVINAGLDKLK